MSEEQTNKIYVDMESLFDLRQAAILKIAEDSKKAMEYLSSRDYIARSMDDFTHLGITEQQYKKSYLNLKFEDLQYTTLSYNFTNVRMRLATNDKINAVEGSVYAPELVLNVFPVKTTPKEKELIRNLIFKKLDVKTKITIIDLPPTTMSPHYIKQLNIATFYCYNFAQWSAFHLDSLVKEQQKTLFIFPEIKQEESSEEEDDVIKELGFDDVFEYLEFFLMKAAPVRFAPVVYYSIMPVAQLYVEAAYEEIIEEEQVRMDNEGDNDGNSSTT